MRRNLLPILAVVGAGLALRLVLAYAVFPNQGFASDLRLFGSWAIALAQRGPAGFYAGDPTANYPPAYLYVLWVLGTISGGGESLGGLLKLPPILADAGVALLVWRLAGRWLGERAGLAAAALYLFMPVTWYDSALWGQVDAVAALAMMLALVLLIEGWSEAAAVATVAAVLVKPQALVCLVVVAPVLLRRHLLVAREPLRLVTSAAAALVAALALMAPFDIAHFAPPSLAGVPVAGDIAGLAGLIRSAGDQYSVLTANAYNLWALVGPRPLAAAVGSWTPDSLQVAGGVSAFTVGTILLLGVALLVAGGLLLRDGVLPIVLGFTVMAFAFYALPTRVHERYLFPVFASGAVLASGVAVRAIGFVVAGLLNVVNVHAILAMPGGGVGGGFRVPPDGVGPANGFPGGGGQRFGGGFGLGRGGVNVSAIQLPLADLARSPAVVTVVALGQTIVMAGLLVAWLVVMGQGNPPAPLPARGENRLDALAIQSDVPESALT